MRRYLIRAALDLQTNRAELLPLSPHRVGDVCHQFFNLLRPSRRGGVKIHVCPQDISLCGHEQIPHRATYEVQPMASRTKAFGQGGHFFENWSEA